MDEFDLDFSNGYSSSIDLLKKDTIKCETNKCKKYALETQEDIKKIVTPFKIPTNTDINNINTNEKIVTKKIKKKNQYDFYLVLLLFLFVNNYSFLTFLHKFRVNYYTSLLIRMLVFGIFYYYGNIYLIRMNKYDLDIL